MQGRLVSKKILFNHLNKDICPILSKGLPATQGGLSPILSCKTNLKMDRIIIWLRLNLLMASCSSSPIRPGRKLRGKRLYLLVSDLKAIIKLVSNQFLTL